MKNSQLSKVLRMVTRTGDKVVVMDQESDAILVMMPFEAYEELVDEQSFNPYSTDWIEDDEEMPDFNWNFDAVPKTVDDEAQSFEMAADSAENFITPEPMMKADDLFKMSQAQKGPEESLAEIPHEEEEEKFYLEPIE